MKNYRRLIWGIILLIAAVVIVLNSFGIIAFDIFFEGWWTLFIIVPSLAGIFEKGKIKDSVFGLVIGIIFLLCAQEIIDWDMVWKLLVPLFIAYIGLKMIFSFFRKGKKKKINIEINGRDVEQGVAVFCGTEMDFSNTEFDGAELVAVFGGIDCDLRRAIIKGDCKLNVACVFGGIDILIPDNVKVVTNTACIFGGVDVLRGNPNAEHTLYIEGAGIFGGVDIK